MRIVTTAGRTLGCPKAPPVFQLMVILAILADHVTNPLNITVGYLTNIYGTNQDRQGMAISGAITYAIALINSNDSILEGHNLGLLYADTKGDTKTGTAALTDLWKKGAIAFFGPEDSCVIEATIASAWNLPMISYVSGLFFFTL